MKRLSLLFILSLFIFGCESNSSEVAKNTSQEQPFVWEAANVYFMLTDRFNNGNKENDVVLNRTKEPAKLRGFMGGDMAGITQKIKEGYFDKLGVNAIWFSPVLEQIHVYAEDIQGGIDNFKKIYPDFKPAKVFFEIGVFRTGGTALDSLVLIGSEIAMTDETVHTGELPEKLNNIKSLAKLNPVKDLAFLNVHGYLSL